MATMSINKLAKPLALASLALGLAACQSASTLSPQPGNLTPAQTGQSSPPAAGTSAALDGVWLPTNEGNVGKYTATFENGQFTTRLTGGGGVIGAGSYKIESPQSIALVWVGEATGTRNSAKCDWAGQTMSCNSDKGFSFQLRKQS